MMQNPKRIDICQTCHRKKPLTKHHLIPKKRHKIEKRHKKKKNRIEKEALNEVIYICRTCHDGIHTLYDERTLSEEFNTLQKLCEDSRLRKHFSWVSKCKKGIK